MDKESDHTTLVSCIMPQNFVFGTIQSESICNFYVDNNMNPGAVTSTLGTSTANLFTCSSFGWEGTVDDKVFVEELSNHFTSSVVFTTDEGRDLRDAAIDHSGAITVCVLSQNQEEEILERLIKTQPFRADIEDWPNRTPWMRASQTQIRYYDLKFGEFRTRDLEGSPHY